MAYGMWRGILIYIVMLHTFFFSTPILYADENRSIQNACTDASDKIQCEMQFIAENSKFVVRIFNHDGKGSGTGIFFKDRDGFGILTNSHVVEKGAKAWVVFPGTEIVQAAEIVGRDEDLDLALLSVSQGGTPRGLVPAKLGRSATLQFGDRVYTAGYPLGTKSVTVGWVNSLTAAIGHYFFSTQAPVHEGNSGGPLFRISGSGELEVIGINTAIKKSGLLTWSLHIDYVVRMIPKLRTEKVVSHSKAGFVASNSIEIPPPIYEELTKTRYPPQKSGVIVMEIEKGSPAEIAGIRAGDMVTALLYEGRAISFTTAEQLFDVLFFELLPGTKVVFVTQRGSNAFNHEVVLGGKKNIPINIKPEYEG